MPELEIQDLDLCFLRFPGHLGRAQNPHAATALANYPHRAWGEPSRCSPGSGPPARPRDVPTAGEPLSEVSLASVFKN